MRRMAIVIAAVCSVLIGSAARASAETLTGRISDAMCGRSHDTKTEHGKKMTDKECTQACVQHGSAYVFVTQDKILKIANQDFSGLKTLAGDTVKVTGDITGDTITVAKIEKAK